MAKPIPTKGPGPKPPEALLQKQTTIHGYRAERLSTYEYQGYRITRQPDGSYKEELFGKPTLLNLVVRKFFEAMAKETNDVYQLNKRIVK